MASQRFYDTTPPGAWYHKHYDWPRVRYFEGLLEDWSAHVEIEVVKPHRVGSYPPRCLSWQAEKRKWHKEKKSECNVKRHKGRECLLHADNYEQHKSYDRILDTYWLTLVFYKWRSIANTERKSPLSLYYLRLWLAITWRVQLLEGGECFLFFPFCYTTISLPVWLSYDRLMSEDECHPCPDTASQSSFHTTPRRVWYLEGLLEDWRVWVEWKLWRYDTCSCGGAVTGWSAEPCSPSSAQAA